LALGPGQAAANLRAPRVTPLAPSSALQAQGLSVQYEDLTFTYDDHCQVSAIYTVTAAATVSAAMSFVLPVREPVTVRVGQDLLEMGPTGPLCEREHQPYHPDSDRGFHGDAARPQFEACFTAALHSGDNTIIVQYVQPFAQHEQDCCYFKKGRFVSLFQYELWPPRQWALISAFNLRVTVSVPRQKPGFFRRHFGKVRSISCRDGAGREKLPGARLEQRGARLFYLAGFRARFVGKPTS
jgi:hypothetical protein